MSARMLNRFRRLDVYRDIPKDLTEQTLVGASVSAVAIIVTVLLFFSQVSVFLRTEVVSEMFVDAESHGGSKININLNISLPQVPCAIASVDVQDIMGSHVLNVGGKLDKMRIRTKDLKPIRNAGRLAPVSAPAVEQIGEGCRLFGSLVVNKVPGNFHISAHSHARQLSKVLAEGEQLNMSHVIHHISFGETDSDFPMQEIPEAVVDPLAGTREMSQNARAPESYEYFIKVVPTQFQKLDGSLYRTYQFVSDSSSNSGRYRIPVVYFRYDFSPITVRFSQKSTGFAHFIVQICAIIGGIVTVLGIVNSTLHSTLHKYIEKAKIGKLP